MFTHEALAYERMYLVFAQRAATQCFSEKILYMMMMMMMMMGMTEFN